jgi:ankyrin repeat protein
LDRGADVAAKTSHGRTALMWAALGAYTDIARALLAKGADVNAVDDNNATALFLAIQGNGPSTVRLLLESGARSDILPKEAGSLWRVTFHSRCDQCAAALLDGGIDVNGKDRFGQTPLMLAVDAARTSTAKLLLDKGADVHARDSQYRTALSRARKKHDQSMIKLLVEYGADSPDIKKRSWP